MIRKKKKEDRTTENKDGTKKERLTKENLIKIGFHIWRQFDDPYYTGFAAQIAYFFFMSSVPTLIVLSQMLGLFDISIDLVKGWLETQLNSRMSNLLSSILNASSGGVSNIIMAALAIWAASSLEFSLSRLMSYTLTSGTYRFNFWTERIKAIPTALLTIFTVGMTMVIIIYSNIALLGISSKLKIPGAARVIVSLRWPFITGGFFAMILMNYYLIPRIRVPLRSVLPGAIVASIGIMIVTLFYTIYTRFSTNQNIIYGSLANIVAMVFWFYLLAWVLCIGVMFNKAWDDIMKKGRLTKDKMIEYLEEQQNVEGEDYKRFFIADDDDDDDNPWNETLAMKMGRKFVKNYDEEINEVIKDDKKRRTPDRAKRKHGRDDGKSAHDGGEDNGKGNGRDEEK